MSFFFVWANESVPVNKSRKKCIVFHGNYFKQVMINALKFKIEKAAPNEGTAL